MSEAPLESHKIAWDTSKARSLLRFVHTFGSTQLTNKEGAFSSYEAPQW